MDRWQENPRHLGPSERAASPSDKFFIEHKEAYQKSTTRLSAREQASWAGRFSDRWSGGSRDYLPVSRTVPDPDPWHTPRQMTVPMEMGGCGRSTTPHPSRAHVCSPGVRARWRERTEPPPAQHRASPGGSRLGSCWLHTWLSASHPHRT